MRRGRALIPLLLLAALFASAQDSVGVYSTRKDYLEKRLTFKSSCQDRKRGIRLNNFLSRSFVSVFDHGKKIRVEKAALFGFRDCESKDYRFFENHDYAMLSHSAELTLYTREILQPKGKTVARESFYFFSNGMEGIILPLTRDNLRYAFPDNWRFHDIVGNQFQDEESLRHYDEIRKEYQLIVAYQHSKNYY